MVSYRAIHEVRVFEPNARDRDELNKALMVFVRNTSSAHRTQANHIQYKFAHPNNPHGAFYYLGLYQDDQIVGFAMFGYYPRRRVIVFDHLTIDKPYRKHRAFYVFATLIQECIEERCPDYDFVVSEIATDPAFADDDVSGRSLIWLLRQIGFGRVQVKYALPNMEARSYRRVFQGALMLRGPQKISQVRSEDLLDVHNVILFEHYLPWFKDFFGEQLQGYEAHLSELQKAFRKQIGSKPTVIVNGSRHDELRDQPRRPRQTFLGLPIRAIGHYTLLLGLFFAVVFSSWILGLHERGMLLLALSVVLAYVGLTAVSDAKALRVFEKIGTVVIKLFSRK
jgi:hypothetical protein